MLYSLSSVFCTNFTQFCNKRTSFIISFLGTKERATDEEVDGCAEGIEFSKVALPNPPDSQGNL